MRILVVISTSDREKALAALMYAINAKRFKWAEDVRVIFFGPAERYIAESDKDFDGYLGKMAELGIDARACKMIAEKGGYEDKIRVKIRTEYVGEYVSKLIGDGYVPLTF